MKSHSSKEICSGGKKSIPVRLLFAGLLVLLILLLALLPAYRQYRRHRKDHTLLRTGEYNTVFLSMYPVYNFNPEDFTHYRADTVAIPDLTVTDYAALRHYLSDVRASRNELRVIYLGIDPTRIGADRIRELKEDFPGVQFEILPMVRTVEEWNAAKDPEQLLAAYRDLAEGLVGVENLRVFDYFTREWLISDPGCFEGEHLFTPETSKIIYLNTDELHGYDLKPETVGPTFEAFEAFLTQKRSTPTVYPDLSDWDIVFFGDSVIGNFTGHHSTPELVATFSGARVFNCGLGGSTASSRPDEVFSLTNMVRYYKTGDLSNLPEDKPAYTGLQQRLAAEQDPNTSRRKLAFVLYYGLNDYFCGSPVASEDPRDITTYAGALRTAYEELKSLHPEALILILAPNFTSYYENGTMINSPEGSDFAAYHRAVSDLNASLGLPTLDIMQDVITSENWTSYLSDGCHPNEYGHFRLANALLEFWLEF